MMTARARSAGFFSSPKAGVHQPIAKGRPPFIGNRHQPKAGPAVDHIPQKFPTGFQPPFFGLKK
jgi:hypothetical protein